MGDVRGERPFLEVVVAELAWTLAPSPPTPWHLGL